MELKLENISKTYPKIHWALKNISLILPANSFTAIVGPSGCGKTTLLRLIAGLEQPDAGSIFMNGQDITQQSPEQRHIGLIFQNDTLFSHLNVFENVAFGLRMRRADNVTEKVTHALSIVHLECYENRNVIQLSGGEKKRVAIARALAFEPVLLLLDEPLNGLDANLKEKTKHLLMELQEKTGLTMVLVTHDLDDAFFLSDRWVIMNRGVIEQTGLPEEFFSHPKNEFVKSFFADYFLVPARTSVKNNRTTLEASFSLPLPEKDLHGKKALINFKKTNYKFIEGDV